MNATKAFRPTKRYKNFCNFLFCIMIPLNYIVRACNLTLKSDSIPPGYTVPFLRYSNLSDYLRKCSRIPTITSYAVTLENRSQRAKVFSAPFRPNCRADFTAMKNLLMLESVDATSIANELQSRYVKSKIYTFLGPVLIAINPYKMLSTREPESEKWISLYDFSIMESYRRREFHLSEPHPFAIAEAAYSNIMRFDRNQSLLITGESGSGKTETSKHVMQYITTMSTHMDLLSKKRRMSVEERNEMDTLVQHVTRALWGSNNVLEAFGNAQTIRNNNSSRFGKYMVLQFNRKGQVFAGYIDHYLLEKSRVVYQAQGERNFHAFYQLLAGASDSDRKEWTLLPAEAYNCLTNDHERVTTIQGVDDSIEYQNVVNNMLAIGISSEEIHLLYQMLAVVLWMGEIQFQETTDEAHNPCAKLTSDADTSHPHKVSGRQAMKIVASLLGIQEEKLESMISFRILTIGNADQKVLFDARQAKKVCHSLSRSLYEKIFTWLIVRLNQSVRTDSPLTKQSVRNSIGILDIYGFEIFHVNAFEQLCINYVNEKLQRLFLAQTLDVEQAEYVQEGLAWQTMEYTNNQRVCDLIEDPKIHGLFPLLDEQCAIARLSDLELIERYNAAHSSHPHYVKSKVQGPFFTILHYAGKVEYDVSMFFEANVDTLFNDLHNGMQESSIPFVVELFCDKRTEEEKLKRPPSTSQQFRSQVELLITKLDGCHPHYIRCIKPNNMKVALEIESELLHEQVRNLGLVENLVVRRQGFCYRQVYASFLQRYKFLSPATWPSSSFYSARQATLALLSTETIGVDNGELIPFQEDADTLGSFSLGRTKIFLKHPQALSALEVLREKKLPEVVGIIEGAWRRYKKRLVVAKFQLAYYDLNRAYQLVLANCQARRMRRPGANDKALVTSLRTSWNDISAKLLHADNGFSVRLAREEQENVIIFAQSFVRARNHRRAFLRLRAAQIQISRRFRGYSTRKNLPAPLQAACRVALLGVRSEFERFMGQKKRRRDTLDREFRGDYIGLAELPAYQSIFTARGSSSCVVFAATVTKVNERFAHQDRILLVTETHIFNIKAAQVAKPKERRAVELGLISKVSMSPLPDDYIVLHVKGEADLLLCVDQKTELVQILCRIVRNSLQRTLLVEFSDVIQVALVRQKLLRVAFKDDKNTQGVSWAKSDRSQMLVTVGMA
uniref:Myosinlike protein putative n=1 Tax=Albugo laibachii Nc14 TaxID=890382 RepID=F0W6T3_9STRA|nr:myosinlike protein putative [Albugo laibachii Nc14]|eukprot:CCA16828.1 myosinlike protein putative [Albugo laibachii Nc14]